MSTTNFAPLLGNSYEAEIIQKVLDDKTFLAVAFNTILDI
jgi:hypothetical protein